MTAYEVFPLIQLIALYPHKLIVFRHPAPLTCSGIVPEAQSSVLVSESSDRVSICDDTCDVTCSRERYNELETFLFVLLMSKQTANSLLIHTFEFKIWSILNFIKWYSVKKCETINLAFLLQHIIFFPLFLSYPLITSASAQGRERVCVRLLNSFCNSIVSLQV